MGEGGQWLSFILALTRLLTPSFTELYVSHSSMSYSAAVKKICGVIWCGKKQLMGHTITEDREPPEPQWSILALLSTIFVNYMTEVTECTSIKFADDTKLVGLDDTPESRAAIH